MKKAYLLAGTSAVAAMVGALFVGPAAAETTLNIATVNNADMIIMQKLSPKFEAATGINLNWVVLEENVLRQRVTTDIATKGGQFDILTIGTYEAPIWGKQGWLEPSTTSPPPTTWTISSSRCGRPVRQRQAVRAAVLRRKLVDVLSQRPVRQGRPEHARRSRPTTRSATSPTRSPTRPHEHLRHLPARQAGLGREHGLRRHAGERLRRPVVRHAVEAAARHARRGRRRSPSTST